MESYDVIIVGGATSGSYLAHQLSRDGHSVLILEAKSEQEVGGKYDIFHIGANDFARFGLPLPVEGEDLAFEFTGGAAFSAFGKHGKPYGGSTTGMHMHPYTLRLNRWAQEAGAQLAYHACFEDFLYTDGKVSGVVYEQDGQRKEACAKLVADCSGIASVARRKLPDGYGVENFEITPLDMFYVTLRYVQYADRVDDVHSLRSWSYYKTWEAPEADPHGAILGVGANLSFDMGEKVFADFEKAVPLPKYTLKYIERGTTPYRRPPYSFVADGFLVSGDAACLTKPSAGEGVTSSLVHLEIAAEVMSGLLRAGAPLDREHLWPINKRYNDGQGAAFASQLGTLVGAVSTNAEENDFFFEKDVIFSSKTYEAMGEGKQLTFSLGELARMATKMMGGILTRRLRISTVRALLRAMGNGDKLSALYKAYPDTPEGFSAWCQQADALWQQCGTMADALMTAVDA